MKLTNYSSGRVDGDHATYCAEVECETFMPAVGMKLECTAKCVTSAGVRAMSSTETPSPFVLFIPRDFSYADENISGIKPGDAFVAEVSVHRAELNDVQVSIIADAASVRVHK
jgi:hypothetical protein